MVQVSSKREYVGKQVLEPSARAVLCESHLFRITGCVAQVFYQPLTEDSFRILSGQVGRGNWLGDPPDGPMSALCTWDDDDDAAYHWQ